MKHDLSIHRTDIDIPLSGMGFERFSDIVSGSLFRGTANRSQSIVVNERDLGIDFGAFRAAPSEVVQSDAPAAAYTGRRFTTGQIIAMIMLSVLVLAVAAYSVIYATQPYMVSGLFEYYLMYLPIPIDYN
ncbi:hypothetical protein [Asticcacaulis machinosus]|uniref:Uncharacterized protein n=1 Tax=Asticcacaulis machinosus TaxID=2984211 RepID=A0ABT5HKH5_9CAUL|nr:hypothetical protein [Asticcacaulis machinosus]MDC7676630.1 hypothetical protein [Asticcacaulis machinosus]